MQLTTVIRMRYLPFSLFLIAHSVTMVYMLNFWRESYSYDHGILVAAISVFIFIKQYKKVTALSHKKESVIGMIMLLISSIIWFMSFIMDIQAIFVSTILLIFISLLVVEHGFAALRHIIFPVTFFAIALPLWDPVQYVLQQLTVAAIAITVPIAHVPVYVKGNYIFIPEGQFLIESTCSGLRYFLAGLAVFGLFVYLNIKSIKNTILFLGVAMATIVILNWVRVFVVIMLGHITNMQHPLVHDHAQFGWVLFVFAIIPLFYFGVILRKREIVANA